MNYFLYKLPYMPSRLVLSRKRRRYLPYLTGERLGVREREEAGLSLIEHVP